MVSRVHPESIASQKLSVALWWTRSKFMGQSRDGRAIVHGPRDNRNPRLSVLKLSFLQCPHLAHVNSLAIAV